MKPEQQRIAIAEACGWKRHYGDGVIVWEKAYVWINPDGRRCDGLWKDGDDTQFWQGGIPNYLNDLNAMHEAEKMLPHKSLTQDYFNVGYGRYQSILCEMSLTPLCATAAQRAEAFLRTLNLWKEE